MRTLSISFCFINAVSISTPELAAACSALTLPTVIPSGTAKEGDIYFHHDPINHTDSLIVYNGTIWITVDITP